MKIFRWIVVLPVALIAFALSNLLLNFGFKIFLPVDGTVIWMKLLFLDILAPGVSAAYLVYAGILIAPSFKKETGIILTIISCILHAGSLFVVYFFPYNTHSILPAVAGILGSTVYCLYFLRIGINDIRLGADF